MAEADSTAAVVDLVGAVKCVLEREGGAEGPSGVTVTDADVGTLRGHLEQINQLIVEFESQRVVVLSSTRLMEAGVALYNAPRAAFRALEAVESGASPANAGVFPRYLLALSRFTAAKIMNVALSWSKSEEGGGSAVSSNRTSFSDECLDVLRCFGRVGMTMLESASIDCGSCQDYLSLAKQAFSLSHEIWAGMGLSYLTKLKQDVELDEILDDLWDFCMDRVRVLKLLWDDSTGGGDDREMIEALHELQMLVPYRLSSVSDLLELLSEVIDCYRSLERHEQQIAFTEEALRVCDAIETFGDDTNPHLTAGFRQSALTSMLESLRIIRDIERSEACYSLLAGQRNADALLCMVKLYVDASIFDKAAHFLRLLFQQDNAELSLQGARAYIQGLKFADEALKIYEELERNYGDLVLEIKVDLACALALSDKRRDLAIAQIRRISNHIDEMKRQGETGPDQHQVARLQQAVFDAVQNATNLGLDEECIEWASTGIALSSTTEESAAYMRILARTYAKLGQHSEAASVAEQALSTDASKKSLFVLLQAELASGNQARVRGLIDDLKSRDDFQCVDLLLVAKEIDSLHCRDELGMIEILEATCELVVNDTRATTSLPRGTLLQNVASLAFQDLKQTTALSNQEGDSPYTSKFAKYAAMLLKASREHDTAEGFGPPTVFEWFYGMCFNIAKSTEKAAFFVLAADIAARSDEMYQDSSPLIGRSSHCLLAAVSSDMKMFDVLDKVQLTETLTTIARYEATRTATEPEVSSYLAKSTLAIKLRLFDPDTDALFAMCRDKLPRRVDEYISFGELVVHATSFNEASQVRKKYRHLARCVFKYGLQVMLQEQALEPSTLCYLVRRLIMLSESPGNTHEWFEQLVQLRGSLDLQFPADDVEWFAGKAWNIGVSCLRIDQRDASQWFLKTALVILEQHGMLAGKLGRNLQVQYQAFVASDRQQSVTNRLATAG